jgi:glutaredoxin
MKKMLIAAIACLALAACGRDESKADIVMYYMPGCPHCHYAMDFFAAELVDATVEKINVTVPGKNQERFIAALQKCGLSSRGVPLIIVQGECIQGYAPEVGQMIKERLTAAKAAK